MLPDYTHREVAKLLKNPDAKGLVEEYRNEVGAYPPYMHWSTDDEAVSRIEWLLGQERQKRKVGANTLAPA